MTEKLYYSDSTLSFSAVVTQRREHSGETVAVVLDRTAFYPEGGGQPGDRGKLEDICVQDTTIDAAGDVLHWVDDPEGSLNPGDRVYGQVDEKRRVDHRQQHSAQHLLSQACLRLWAWETVGFHLGSDTVTIDLNTTRAEWAQLLEAEHLANQVVFEDLPRTVRLYSRADIVPEQLRRMARDLLTDPDTRDGEPLRIVSFGDFDSTACGGTHVARTGQIGLIKVCAVEPERGRVRVHFTAGWRLLTRLERYRRVDAQLGELLTTGLDNYVDAVASLLKQNRELGSELRSTQARLTDYRAAELLAEAEPLPSGETLVVTLEQDEMRGLQSLATSIVQHPGVIALLGGISGNSAGFVYTAPDIKRLNCSEVLRESVIARGGRGGGNEERAQGGGVPAEQAEAVLATARRLVEKLLGGRIQ